MDLKGASTKLSISVIVLGASLVALGLPWFCHAAAEVKLRSEWSPGHVMDPLIYKRLRFDPYFLQIYRRFQQEFAIDEKKVTVKFNETWAACSADQNATKPTTKEVAYSYYENRHVDATQFTYDDMVFEALDRAYHTRLWPAYIYNYDNHDDMSKASDPAKVSCSKCDKELDFLMRSLDQVRESRRRHSKTGIQLSNSISPELLAFFDAFAGEENGLLLGNSHWTGGTWRECRKRLIFNMDRSNASNSVEFHGRYCIASIRSSRWSSKIPERVAEMEAYKHFEYADQKINYARFFRIQLGLCLPESCDSRVIERRRADIHKLATFKLSQPLASYELVDLYCLPDENSKLRELEPAGRLFVAAAIVWLLVVLAATIHDYHEERSKEDSKARNKLTGELTNNTAQSTAPAPAPAHLPSAELSFSAKIVSAFSLLKNFERLTETKSCQATPVLSERLTDLRTAIVAANTRPKPATIGAEGAPAVAGPKMAPNDLLFLNFIKALCMPMILLGHVGMQWKQLDRFPNDYDALSSIFSNFHFSAVFFVDWFFAISGFLTAYIMFVTRKPERNTLLNWLYSIVHRYWRLAPLYILLFWFGQSVFMHTSSGPLWDYGSNNMTFRSICRRESYLSPLTLTSNFHPIHSECIMPAWYISCDFQFYLLMPLVLVLLHKSALLGWLACCGTIGVCVSLRLHRYLTDVRAKPLELMRPRYDLYMRNNWDMYTTYILPHYRISSYLVGILAGHYVYMVLSGKWRSSVHVDPAALVAANQAGRGRGRTKTAAQMEFIIERAKSRRLLMWLLGAGMMGTMMWATWLVSSFFPVNWEPQVKYFTAFIYASHHTLVALAVSLFLVAMMLGQFEELMSIMCWPIWTVITRLNYLVFLVQVEAIYWFVQSADRLSELNDLQCISMQLCLMAFLYALSAVLALIVELPLIQIEKYFIHPMFNRRKPAAALSAAAGDRSRRLANETLTLAGARNKDNETAPRLCQAPGGK